MWALKYWNSSGILRIYGWERMGTPPHTLMLRETALEGTEEGIWSLLSGLGKISCRVPGKLPESHWCSVPSQMPILLESAEIKQYFFCYTHMYVCTHACMHACMYALCKHACVHVCICVCIQVCMYVCVCACMCVCIYVCMYVYNIHLNFNEFQTFPSLILGYSGLNHRLWGLTQSADFSSPGLSFEWWTMTYEL